MSLLSLNFLLSLLIDGTALFLESKKFILILLTPGFEPLLENKDFLPYLCGPLHLCDLFHEISDPDLLQFDRVGIVLGQGCQPFDIACQSLDLVLEHNVDRATDLGVLDEVGVCIGLSSRSVSSMAQEKFLVSRTYHQSGEPMLNVLEREDTVEFLAVCLC